MPNYPTKEEILEKEQKFKPETIEIIKTWKKIEWNAEKSFESLKALAKVLASIYEKPVRVEFVSNYPTCCYQPATQTIIINNSTSIISLLHEFAHHLYGPSELKACRWSVWLFKKTFPKSYAKLKWQGHMLIK